METLKFTVQKMFTFGAGNLKAFADVIVNDQIVIRGIRIIEGKKGLFVSMPQEQGKDNKWYDQIVFTSSKTYDDINTAVLNHYNDQVTP
jgi:stage V sporulation protein G